MRPIRQRHFALMLMGIAALGTLARAVPAFAAPMFAVSMFPAPAPAAQPELPPPSTVAIFPLSQVHAGLHGTAWTVFEGTTPEPMDVEILGILRNARGPGQDMILARLHGTHPEYTGVVAGMSGSPVYIDGKLLGALSFRIGQFTREPIAGITPIADMLEVRDMATVPNAAAAQPASLNTSLNTRLKLSPETSPAGPASPDAGPASLQAMDTPLLLSGFSPQAVNLWRTRMAGTGLDAIAVGGPAGPDNAANPKVEPNSPEAAKPAPILPGSAVSLLLVSGDMEIAATCTVTYVDPRQLLACGHPIQQSGQISAPMTTADVLLTLASPLNSFKIVNTGRTIGAFTQDRNAAIGGELGATAHTIPLNIVVSAEPGGQPSVTHRLQVVDLPQLTPSLVLVSVYQGLLETNVSSADSSYHITGSVHIAGQPAVPVNLWGAPSDTMASQLQAAFGLGDLFDRLYASPTRISPIQSIDLHVTAFPRDLRTEITSARILSSGIVHPGDTVTVEATLRTQHGEARNLRLPIVVPARTPAGALRVLVSGSATLDRTLDGARPLSQPASLTATENRLAAQHPADQLYVSLLMPESEAAIDGQTLGNLPLSLANSLEDQHGAGYVGLHGETLAIAATAPAGGILTGQVLLNLHIEPGGGLN